jgi:hypothetical protein
VGKRGIANAVTYPQRAALGRATGIFFDRRDRPDGLGITDSSCAVRGA